MDKLELDLEDLVVDTFSADTEDTEPGTVEGNWSETCPEVCFFDSEGEETCMGLPAPAPCTEYC